MNSSDHRRRRRKRLLILRPHPSVRSLASCFTFIASLYILSSSFSLNSSAALSFLSHFSIARPVRHISGFFQVENRVLFPDHVLLLVTPANKFRLSELDLECVYLSSDSGFRDFGNEFVQNVLSVDEFDEFSSIVRCPLPILSSNYSGGVNLKYRGKNAILGFDRGKIAPFGNCCSWDNVVYGATIDGSSAVVFAKGLNLRADRKYDPRQFDCRFGFGKWEYTIVTEALTVAQEVVRCSLPRSIHGSLHGVPVSIGVNHLVLPSVAKISRLRSGSGRDNKYELCVCTMVWNQASFIKEWIMYHSWLGVQKWFIYDNNSDDGIDEVIEELDAMDYNVTRVVWPWIKTQEAGFSHCAMRAREECRWVSFMDVDEYFYFPYSRRRRKFRKRGYAGEGALRTLVANVSSSSRTTGEIRISCYSFGPSGLDSRPQQGVTVGYTCRLQRPERHKSIVRPDALDSTLLNVVHHFHLKKGFKYVNLAQGIGVINHYKYQVWEVFRAKFHRRVATYVVDWKENQNEGSRDRVPGLGTEGIEPRDWSHRFCEVWDTGLRDFVLANLGDVSSGLLPWQM